MIPLQEAQRLVWQQASTFGTSIIPLEDALGRTLAQTIIADRHYPPFTRATMDGIAIAFSDWENGIRQYALTETIFAGEQHTQSLAPASCYKIMTGAAVPAAADTVIRKEDIEIVENRVSVNVIGIVEGQNIAIMGSDLKKGSVILNKPQRMLPGTITTLSALGYATISVSRMPQVAIITTGNEIVPVDAPVSSVQIRNSNAALLKSLLQQDKIIPVSCQHVPDNKAALLTAISSQRNRDIIILSGAVSAGDADFVPEVLLQAGAEKIFHQVAIRPGKPIWFGQFKNGATIFALPGNPFSTMVTYKLFVETFIAACVGLLPLQTMQFPLNGNRIKKTNLDEFFPVVFSGHPTAATPLPFNNSGDITAMMMAEGLGMQPADQIAINNGDIITCIC